MSNDINDFLAGLASNYGGDSAAPAPASVPDDGMGNVGSAAAAPAATGSDGMVDMTGFRTGGDAASYFPSTIDNASTANMLGSGMTGTSNADMASLFNTGNGLGSGMGDALDPAKAGGFASTTANSGSSDDFMTNLMDKVKKGVFNPKDPLGSILGLVNIAAQLRNMKTGGHNDLGMVTNLVNQGKADPFKAANQIPAAGALTPVRGRAASSFIAPAASGPLSLIRKV